MSVAPSLYSDLRPFACPITLVSPTVCVAKRDLFQRVPRVLGAVLGHTGDCRSFACPKTVPLIHLSCKEFMDSPISHFTPVIFLLVSG